MLDQSSLTINTNTQTGTTHIEVGAFSDHSSLAQIIIPEDVTKISTSHF
jgi:hypothetical protein